MEWVENTPFYNGNYRPVNLNTRKTTRVIAFLNKQEYKDELNKLEADTLNLVLWEDLRVARVTNTKIIKHFKEKHDNVWFDKLSSNAITLFRRKEDFIGNQD